MTALTRYRLLPLLAAGLSACTGLAPTDRPAMPLPAHYAASAIPADLPKADGASQHLRTGMAPIPEWWKSYQSAELDARVAEGLANNPSLDATRHALDAARAALRAQLGQTEYPTVDVSLGKLRQRTLNLPGMLPLTYQDSVLNGEVNASWSFNLLGATVLANQALASKTEQQFLQLEAGRRALATNIVLTAINAAALQAELRESTRMADLAAQQAQQIAQRYQLGSAAQSDMLSARQQAAALAANLPGLRAKVLALCHAEATLLGRNPEDAPQPLDLDALHLPTEIPQSLPSALLRQRPDIQAAEAAVNAAAAEAGAARAALFPSLSLTAAYGRGGYDWSTFSSPAGLIWSAGASLVQPLFHGGALLAKKDEARALYDAATQQYRQTVLNAFREVADNLADLDDDADRLAQTDIAAGAARQNWNDSQLRYQLGAATSYDALQAEQNYRNAQILVLQARAARLADTATLLDAMGELPKRFD